MEQFCSNTWQLILRDHVMEEIYFAGGCLWGVQEFMKHLPGVIVTEAGRANGTNQDLSLIHI